MPDDIRELRHPDFFGLQLAEQPVTQGARIARNVDTWKYGLLNKRPGLRRMNHRQYTGQIVALADLQRICDYGKFLILSGFAAGGEVYEHQQTWADPCPASGSGGPDGGGGGGGTGGSITPTGNPPEPPFEENWPPVVAASADTAATCVGVPIAFSSAGCWDPDGAVVMYLWDFGDGNISPQANPIHVYDTPGNYNVTLTVTDNDGGSSTSAAIPISIVALTPQFTTAQFDTGVFVGGANGFLALCHDTVNEEIGVAYAAPNGGAGTDMYFSVLDAAGLVQQIAPLSLKTITAYGGGMDIDFDGAEYGILYLDWNAAQQQVRFMRVNRLGAITTGPTTIEAGNHPNARVWIAWNGTNYGLFYGDPAAPLTSRFARITTGGALVGLPATVPNAPWRYRGLDSDGIGWLVAYRTGVGALECRYISAAGAISPPLVLAPAIAPTELSVEWDGNTFGVAYRVGVALFMDRVNAVPAQVGATLAIAALGITPRLARHPSGGWFCMYAPGAGNNVAIEIAPDATILTGPYDLGQAQPTVNQVDGYGSASKSMFAIDDDVIGVSLICVP